MRAGKRLHLLSAQLRPAAGNVSEIRIPTASSLAGPASCCSMREGGPSQEACAQHLLEHGFLLVDDILVGDELSTAQSALNLHMEPAREKWMAALARGVQPGDELEGQIVVSPPSDGYFDIPRVVEQEQSFMDIVAHARITSILDKVIGQDLQLLNIQCRNYPAQSADKAAETGGYAGWHTDRAYGVVHNNQHALHVVVMFYFFDVGLHDGATALVPDSHLVYDKSELLASQKEGAGANRQFSMEGMLACDRRGGSAVIFDERALHSAMPNVGGKDRRSITTRWAPYWVKQTGTVQMFARSLEKQGRLTTPLLRQVFGIEPLHAEGKWFDSGYAGAHFRPDLR